MSFELLYPLLRGGKGCVINIHYANCHSEELLRRRISESASVCIHVYVIEILPPLGRLDDNKRIVR